MCSEILSCHAISLFPRPAANRFNISLSRGESAWPAPSPRNGAPVADFSPYRDALLRALSELAGLSPTEFEAALHKPTDIELETEREQVVQTLAEQRRVNA